MLMGWHAVRQGGSWGLGSWDDEISVNGEDGEKMPVYTFSYLAMNMLAERAAMTQGRDEWAGEKSYRPTREYLQCGNQVDT